MSCQAYGPRAPARLATGHRMPTRAGRTNPPGPALPVPAPDRFPTAKLRVQPIRRDIADTFSVDNSRSISYPYASFPLRFQIVTRGSGQHQINRYSAFGKPPARCTIMRSIAPPYKLGTKMAMSTIQLLNHGILTSIAD